MGWRRFKEQISKFFHAFLPKEREEPEVEYPPFIEPAPKPEHVHRGIVTARSVQDVREQIDKMREEQIKREYLREPRKITRRRIHTRAPPAERHRQAISKFMKGKGKQSKYYRRTIKKSPSIRIEEEDD